MKQKWSKEKIVETIRELRKQNIDISAGNISKNYIPLFMAVCSKRYFSSWGSAVTAAGIDYEQIMEAGQKRRLQKLRKWSKERILEEIRGTGFRELVKTYRDRLPLYSAARKEFGNWHLALAAAGYQLAKGTYKNSKRINSAKKKEIH